MAVRLEKSSENYIERDASLFKAYISSNENDILKEILEKYSPLIKKEASRFFSAHCKSKNYSIKNTLVEFDDFYHAAIEGFIISLKHFDPNLGYNLAPLALCYIKNQLSKLYFSNSSVLKISTTFKSLFLSLNKIKKTNSDHQSSFEEIEQLKKLCINYQIKYSERVLSAYNAFKVPTKSYDYNPLLEDNDISNEIDLNYLDEIKSSTKNEDYQINIIDHSRLKIKLYNLIASLNKNEKFIINKLFLDNENLTLTDLSKTLSLSVERVRQIKNNALNKIKLSGGIELKLFLNS